MVENVFFRVEDGKGGNKFKGDYQLFAKNTAFDCFVAIPRGWGDTDIHNENSLVCNNLVDHLVEQHRLGALAQPSPRRPAIRFLWISEVPT